MLVPGDLGFCLAAVFLFAVLPVFGVVLRRKWRLAVARREEINRLLVLAAEEAVRAEYEASIGYFVAPTPPPPRPVVVPSHRVCAVCFVPTPHRCARCKSVNYCSGKCQIVHWRQGHKDECRPLPAGSEINDEATSFLGSTLKQPNSDDYVADIENDGLPCDGQGESAPEGHRLPGNAFLSPGVSVKDDIAVPDSYILGEEPGSVSVLHDISVSSGVPTPMPGRGICIDGSSSDDDSLHDLSSESCDSSSTFDSFESASTDTQMEQIKLLEKKAYMRVDFDGSVTASGGLKDEALGGTSIPLRSRVSHSHKNSIEPSSSKTGFWDGTLDASKTRKYVPSDKAKLKLVGAVDGKLLDLKSTVQAPAEPSDGLSSDECPRVSEIVANDPGTARTGKRAVETSSHNKESAADIQRQSSKLLSSRGPGTGIKRADESQVKSGEVGAASFSSKGVSLLSSSSRPNYKETNKQDPQQLLTSQNAVISPKQANGFSSSGMKGHAVLPGKPAKAVGNTAVLPQVARSAPSAAVGLKSSVTKVVEQLRGPRSSKQGESLGRNGDKAVFAYDSFVKLYHWNKVELRPCGLINCGNSCYANVVLQCLAFTPPLTAYLLQGLHSKTCLKKEWCFTCEFERLVLKANEVGYAQSPIGILSQLQKIGRHLTNGREEDAHEFLRYGIETMQSICLKEAELKGSSLLEEETTLLGLTFGGYLRSKIKCTRCHGKTEKQERMMDLTVEIQGDIDTLEDALRQFTGTEILDGENKYHCGRCKSYEKAKKKLNILEAPNVLTVALKRFQSGKFGKLNKSIRFPEILNLAPYMRGGSDKAPIYRLYGVVVHLDIMNASFSGHYVCYVRNAQNKWFKIDDSTVKPVELDRVLNKGAYMLFYSRCSPRAPRSIRSTIVSRDSSRKIKTPAVDVSHSNGSASRQRDLSAHANHIPDDLCDLGYARRDDTRSPTLHNINDFDSSSDNSSIFSNSDEVSTSTDSNRDSISADEMSEYFFGYRPLDWDTSSSSSSSSSSPQYMRHSPLSNLERYASALPEQNVLLTDNGKACHESYRADDSGSMGGGVAFLHSNSSSQVRNRVNISGSEADAKSLGRANPLNNGKSAVHLSSRKYLD